MAPRSMPAGLSQITQSKLLRNSAITRPTPSSVSASLSLVCEAGSSQRFSSRLSRIRACGSLATPCTTLMRSNTTRRSAPMTRSRLRRPTSKSTTTTFSPACASAAPMAAVVVVLPTPPLPDVTTSTFAISQTSRYSVQSYDLHGMTFEPRLRGAAAQCGIDLLCGLVVAIDRDQLGLDLLAVDARGGIAVDAGHRAAAQRAVDVDGAAGDDLGAGRHRAEHGDVAVGKHDRLAGAHGLIEQQRGRLLQRRLLRLDFLHRAVTAARQQRRHAEREPALLDAFEAEHTDVARFDALDEMRDGERAQIHGGEIEHNRRSEEHTSELQSP